MAVYLPGVVAQLQTIGGTAIGGLSRLNVTVIGRGDAKVSPVNLRSLRLVPVPGGGSATFTPVVSTAGTSTSAASPATATTLADTLTLNLNGDGAQTISLATSGTGAAVAADIQAKVRALIAATPSNQSAFNNFTAAFTTVYVLTSGTVGTGSTVVVTGGTDAPTLKLGLANGGVEVAGTTLPIMYYVITAVNSTGETLTSNELNIVSPGTSSALAVNWDAITGVGVTAYHVWRSTTSGSYTNKLIATVSGELSASYIDTGVATQTATFPSAATALKQPYNTFRTFTSMTLMRTTFGSLNNLGMAAQLAQMMGLNTLSAVSVNFTAVDAAPNPTAALIAKEAAYEAALESLLSHPTDIVVCLDPEPEISLKGKAHVALASDPVEWKMERALFTAGGLNDTLGDTATPGTLVYNTVQSFNNRLVSAWAPVSPYAIMLDDSGNASEVALTGSFTALAAAIMNAMQPDEATPITNKQFVAFTRFGTNFNRGDLMILDPYGVATMTIDANGVTTIVHGETTATDTYEDNELNVTLQEDKLLQALRGAVAFAIGQKNSDIVRLAVHDKIAQVLQGRVSQGLMTDWSGLEVLQDKARPTFILVNFLHTPMFGVNVVLISLAFDTRSSVTS